MNKDSIFSEKAWPAEGRRERRGERKCCEGCPDCQGIPAPRSCTGTAWTGDRQCILDEGHGGLCK